MKSSILPSLACFLLVAVVVSPAQQAEPVDEKAVEFLRKQGLEESQVMDHLSWICDVYGPRLTGSPNLKKAQAWAQKQLAEWGLENPHLEAWGPFGKGWRLDHAHIEIVGDNPWPVHAWPKAWSPSLPGRVEGEVIDVSDMSKDELEATDLTGKIVLMQTPREISEPFEAQSKRIDDKQLLAMANGTRRVRSGNRNRGRRRGRDSAGTVVRGQQMLRMIYDKKPVAILDRSFKGDYGTIFVSSASLPRAENADRRSRPRAWQAAEGEIIPQFTLAVEHYNRIGRILKKGLPVRLALELDVTFFDDDPMQYNVLAEIPGTDPEVGDEVVMIGAHFDSWHSSTGATDNGCGSAVMMEAIRLVSELVKERGTGPRRTIRIALWSGEEQGLLGSRGYVAEHFAESGGRGKPPKSIKPEHAKLSGYFNLDNGTGRVRGIYTQKNEAVAPIFRAWLQPFHDLDASTVTLRNTGGTDHQAFDGVGLPGFQFIQDPVSYSPKTHHSNMDGWDHAVADDLKQAATIIASFAWHTSQRDDKLPRKPLPAPKPKE